MHEIFWFNGQGTTPFFQANELKYITKKRGKKYLHLDLRMSIKREKASLFICWI